MRKPEVICYGELLIDFSQCGRGPLGFPIYEALPGGAPANVAVALSKWGHGVSFIGQVGSDAMGSQLRQTLVSAGVDDSRLSTVPKPTAMAIVSLDATGDRSFDILWKGTSCEALPVAEPGTSTLPKIFHFGSVSLCDSEGRKNTLATVRRFKEAGCWISFDPNLRPKLWDSLSVARNAMEDGLKIADFVKISEEEVAFLLGEPVQDTTEQTRRLWEIYRPPVLFVTLGPQGCLWVEDSQTLDQPTPKVTVVDTTGAGDCFMAGMIHILLKLDLNSKNFGPNVRKEMANFAVAAGTASTQKRGGIPAIPSLEEIHSFDTRF